MTVTQIPARAHGAALTRLSWPLAQIAWLMLTMGLAPAAPAAGVPMAPVILADGTDVPVTVHAARGRDLLLWLPSEVGQVTQEAQAASRLAVDGTEVWQADLLSARFLPPLPSSMEQIAGEDVAALIDTAIARTGKRVYLITSGRGAKAALHGAEAWRTHHPRAAGLGGAVLLHPNLYVGTPDPGSEATYLSVVARVRLPVCIIQPDLSPLRWYVERLTAELEKGGSRVCVRRLPGVRDRFYFRHDATPAEDAVGARLPALVGEALASLQSK